MDMSETIQPRSDQMNFDDVAAVPATVTITAVTRGSAEQPVNIQTAEYPNRPWKPSKSMRRVLVKAWGKDSDAYVGRRVRLVGNPDVKYAGKAVGGIQIEAVSHIDKPIKMALTVSRGKREPFTIQPLTDAPAAPQGLTDAQIAACESIDELRAMWRTASSVQQQQINARVAQLTGEVSE